MSFHDVEQWLKSKLTGKVYYSDLFLALEYCKARPTPENVALYRRLLKRYQNQQRRKHQ